MAAGRLTPLAAPLLLEIGQVPIRGLSAEEAVLMEEAAILAEIGAEG